MTPISALRHALICGAMFLSFAHEANAQVTSSSPESLAANLMGQFFDAPADSVRVLKIPGTGASVIAIAQASNFTCRFVTRAVAGEWAAESFECKKDTPKNAY